MSTRNNSRPHLTAKQKLEKQKMIANLEKEIKKLEFTIKHEKLVNKKIEALKYLKYCLKTLQLLAPYAMTATIVFGSFCIFGDAPFVRDDIKKYLRTAKTYDSYGNVSYEEQYDDFKNPEGTVTYYSKWEKVDNEFYSREVKKYEIGKITNEEVEKLINSNDTASLEDIFGKEVSSSTEKRNNLTEEEINRDPYLEALIYSESDNEFIVVKESVADNIGWTAVCLILAVAAEILPLGYRVEISSFDYEESLRRIKESSNSINNTRELKKRLEIKKSNYKRLTR